MTKPQEPSANIGVLEQQGGSFKSNAKYKKMYENAEEEEKGEGEAEEEEIGIIIQVLVLWLLPPPLDSIS